MPDNEMNISLNDISENVLMHYYNHQYERMGKLEDQRTAVTNITTTLSVLAFTFGFNDAVGFSKLVGYALLSVMILANIFAIAYVLKTKSWINTHEKRAKGILEKRYVALHVFDRKTHAKYKSWAPRRWQIQMALHILLLSVASALAMFLWSS